MITARIIALVVGYICGLFETGLVLGKKKNVDLRQHGSGNSGATNTLRTLGVKSGIIVFVGDILKTVLAIWITHFLFRNTYPEQLKVIELYAGFGAILGHNFPFYLKFKGGKGMSCTAGIVFGYCPAMLPFAAAGFLLPVILTRYVSLGSILVYVFLPVIFYVYMQKGWLAVPAEYQMEVLIVVLLMAALAWWRHRANIKRLLNGTESKISFSKK